MTTEQSRFAKQGRKQPWMRYLALAPFVAGAAVLSAFFFTAIIVLFLMATIGFGLRTWWLRRRLRSAASYAPPGQAQPLEGEYTIVSEDESGDGAEAARRARR